MIIAVIKGVVVSQDENGVVTWISGAQIDADGSNGQNGGPFAYRYPDDNGLDRLNDAGYPFHGWKNVLLDNGSGFPLTDGHGNAYSQTTYAWPGRSLKDRFLDATTVPYIVVNPSVRLHARGVIIGAHATVTFQGKIVEAVVGDVSGPSDIGEISIACARALGIGDSPLSGGVPRGVLFTIFAGQAAIVENITYELQAA